MGGIVTETLGGAGGGTVLLLGVWWGRHALKVHVVDHGPYG